MKIGLSTATLFGNNTHLIDNLDKVRAMDFRVIEVFFNTFSEYSTKYALTLLPKLTNITVNSVHTLNNFEGQLFNSYDKAFNEAADIFRGALAAGKVLNARYYTFHGFPKKINSSNYMNYERLGNTYRKLTNIAEEYGIVLTQENVSWACYEKPPYFTEIVKYAPKLMACLDIKQAMRAGVDYIDYIKDMSDRIATVHISDYDSSGRLCPPGKGRVDYIRLFSALKEQGFDGNVLIELYKEDYQSLSELIEARDYLQNIIEKRF